MVPPFTLNDTTPLKQIFKDCKGKKGAAVSLGKEDNAFLQYTGGTTGFLKELPISWKYLCKCSAGGSLDWT